MAIYASRTRKTNTFIPEFKLVSTPMAGDALVYDARLGAFVNKQIGDASGNGNGNGGEPNQDLANYVTGGHNLSSNISIFRGKTNQLLEFRGLVGGPGISIGNLGNDLRIANELVDTGRWQNDGIDIVFESGGSMQFYRRDNRFEFKPTVVASFPSGDITVIADTYGKIVTASQNFEWLGFFAGQKIIIDGTDEQDGQYFIASVSHNTITLTTAFESNLDAGVQPPVTITGSRLQINNSISFTLYGADLSLNRLVAGDVFVLEGTSQNDGRYTVQEVSGNLITIEEVFAGPFGYEFGDITINTIEEDISTGVYIDDNGGIGASQAEFDTAHVGDLYVEDIFINGGDLEDYIKSFNDINPIGGILVNTDDGMQVREIEVGDGLDIQDPDGYDRNPKISLKDFYLNFDGDVNGYSVISGLANTTISIDLKLVGSPGQYNLVTVDDKGRVTSGTKRIIKPGPGMNVINGDMTYGDPVIHPNDFTITLEGDVSGQATVTDLGDVTITTSMNLPNANMPTGQWFNRVQVNPMGWVVSASNQAMLYSNGIHIHNADGVAGPPVFSVNDFNITFNGDVYGTAEVNGLQSTTVQLTLPDIVPVGTYNNVTVDAKGRVVSGSNVTFNYQAPSPLLDELSNPNFTSGFMTWNGSSYGTTGIRGDGQTVDVAHNGTELVISIPSDPVFNGYGSISIPYGPTHFRPITPSVGMVRINTDETVIEAYINGSWHQFFSGTADPSLELQGGTMTGDIDMSGNDLNDVGTINGYVLEDYFDIVDEFADTSGLVVNTPNGMVGRTLKVLNNNGITIDNADGINGDPTISFNVFDFVTSATLPKGSDELIYYDMESNTTKKTTIDRAFRKQAQDFFMSQF